MMGLRHYDYVWKNYKRSGSHKLVLMALAEHANENNECWPSMQTIADMACVSLRQVVNIINDLRESGHIETIATRGRSQSNIYKLTLKCEADCTLLNENEGKNNVKSSVNNVKPSTNNVKPSTIKCEMGFTQTYIEPNTINTLSTNVDEQARPNSVLSGGKKEKRTSKKSTASTQPPTDDNDDTASTQTPEQQEWFGALCWLVYGHKEYKLLSKIDKIAIGKTAKEIRELEYTIDDLRNWYKTIWCKEFPGLQKGGAIQNPRLKDIKTGIGKVKPTPHTNGFNAPVVQANIPTYRRIAQL